MSKLGPHPAEQAEVRYCAHGECKAHAADEMMFMAKELMRQDIADVAMESLNPGVLVRCRRVPRKGPIRAPLPPRADSFDRA